MPVTDKTSNLTTSNSTLGLSEDYNDQDIGVTAIGNAYMIMYRPDAMNYKNLSITIDNTDSSYSVTVYIYASNYSDVKAYSSDSTGWAEVDNFTIAASGNKPWRTDMEYKKYCVLVYASNSSHAGLYANAFWEKEVWN